MTMCAYIQLNIRRPMWRATGAETNNGKNLKVAGNNVLFTHSFHSVSDSSDLDAIVKTRSLHLDQFVLCDMM